MSAQWAARRLEENPFDKAGKRKPTVSVIQKGGAQCKEMACRIAVNLRFFPCSGSICTVEEDFELNPMEGEAIVISPDSSDARLFDVRCAGAYIFGMRVTAGIRLLETRRRISGLLAWQGGGKLSFMERVRWELTGLSAPFHRCRLAFQPGQARYEYR